MDRYSTDIDLLDGTDVKWSRIVRERCHYKIWSELLMEWPEDAFHHLVDLQPEGEGIPWRIVDVLSQYAEKQWHEGLQSQEVLKENGVSFPSIWWGERIGDVDLHLFRQNPSRVMWVLMCRDSHIYGIGGTFSELVLQYPVLFFSPQLAFLRMIVGVQRICVEIPEKEKTMVTPLFLIATGPRPADITVFVGDIQTAYETLVLATQVYLFCKKPLKSRERTQASDEIKAMWLRTTFKYSKEKDFLNPEYYALQMHTYSAWSYTVHQQQVKQLLQFVPSTTSVVAPGDSIGVVAQAWTGLLPVISGDLVVTDWSKGVKKESLRETMERGCQEGSLLVLSYVLSLMTEEERSFVQQWPGPIGVLEPKNTMTLTGFRLVGPGVWVRGFPESWTPVITMAEQMLSVDQVLFSENLLALEEISYMTLNPAVLYWKRMRPQGRAVAWQRGESAPLVINTLVEWRDFWNVFETAMVYAVFLGRVWDGQVFDVLLDVKTKVPWREVFSIPRGSKWVSELKRVCHWVERDKLFLFTFSYCKEIELSSSHSKLTLTVQKECRIISVKLVGITITEAMILTNRGTLLVPMGSFLSVTLLQYYAKAFGLELHPYKIDKDRAMGGRHLLTREAKPWETQKGIFSYLDNCIPDYYASPLQWKQKINNNVKGPKEKIVWKMLGSC